MPETTAPKRGHRGNLWQRGRRKVWYIAWSQNGRRYRKCTKTTRREDAQRQLDEIRGRLARGERTAPSSRTFKQLADALRTYYEVNELRSLRRAEGSLAHLTAFFGEDTKATAITTDRMREYIKERRREVIGPKGPKAKVDPKHPNYATIQNELATLGKMLTLAVEDGYLTHRPKVPRLKLDNARQGFFEEADLRAVVAKLPSELQPPILFAYYTGWRIGEILALTWRQVDFKAGTVRLEPGTTKNRKGRTFPFAALPALKTLLEAQQATTTATQRATGAIVPWVFHRPDGGPIASYRKAWIAACDRAAHEERDGGVRELVRPQLIGKLVHDLRRTAVRNLERASVPRSVAMKLTGHLTESVYNRYAIVSEGDLREGVGKLATLHAAVG